jgi:hypothetical protein
VVVAPGTFGNKSGIGLKFRQKTASQCRSRFNTGSARAFVTGGTPSAIPSATAVAIRACLVDIVADRLFIGELIGDIDLPLRNSSPDIAGFG